jgi:hypothetical protein
VFSFTPSQPIKTELLLDDPARKPICILKEVIFNKDPVTLIDPPVFIRLTDICAEKRII